MQRRYGLMGLLLGALLFSACGAPGAGAPGSAITAREPWVRAAVVTGAASAPMTATETMGHGGAAHGHGGHGGGNSGNSAAYMTLVNAGATDDAVVGATTDASDVVELHETTMEGDLMRMNPVTEIVIPANGEVELKPGGLHIMLIGLKQDLQAGDTVNLTLNLRSGGVITLAAPVRQP